MNWVSHVRNRPHVAGIFGDEPPELKSVRLLDLLFQPTQPPTCYFSVALSKLPASLPQRWLAEGRDSVHLRCFADLAGPVKVEGATFSNHLIDLEITEHALRLVSVDNSWEVSLRVHGLDVHVFSFRASEYEFEPQWFVPRF